MATWLLAGAPVAMAAHAGDMPPPDDLADEPRSVTFLGYHHHPHSPAIWVATNEAAKAWLVAVAPDHSRLHVEHAVLSRSVWGLPIDTSCFGGPIRSITATPQEEPQTGVAIDILHRPGTHLALTKQGSRLLVRANGQSARPSAEPTRLKKGPRRMFRPHRKLP